MARIARGIFIGVALAIGAATVTPAEAGGGHRGWRTSVYVGVGPGFYRPWGYGVGYGYGYGYGVGYGYPWGYWGAPPIVVTQPGPTAYIERADVAPAPPAGFWYWCAESRAYYPSVPTCASTWVPVPPRADGAPG
ncbi:MAG: hypothetical protein ACOYLX_14005 [Burkholderiaceae bacterium]